MTGTFHGGEGRGGRSHNTHTKQKRNKIKHAQPYRIGCSIEKQSNNYAAKVGCHLSLKEYVHPCVVFSTYACCLTGSVQEGLP